MEENARLKFESPIIIEAARKITMSRGKSSGTNGGGYEPVFSSRGKSGGTTNNRYDPVFYGIKKPSKPPRKRMEKRDEEESTEQQRIEDDIERPLNLPRKRIELQTEEEAIEYVNERRIERAHKKRLAKKRQLIASVKALAVIIGATAAVGLIWYIHGIVIYNDIFLDNTFINGVSVGKISADDAVQLVKQHCNIPGVITLTKPDGTDIIVPLADLDSTDNIRESVDKFFKSQSRLGWIKARNKKTEYEFSPDFSFSHEKLHDLVGIKIIDGNNPTEPKNARIERTSVGFQIIPEVAVLKNDENTAQTLYNYIDEALDSGTYSIDLKKSGCCILPEITSDNLRDDLKVLNHLNSVEFTLDYGFAKEKLAGRQVLDWITFDTSGQESGFTVDKNKAESYIESVAKKHDTFGKSRQFKSTTRGEMTIEQGDGCYGWLTDYSRTADKLIELIHNGDSASFEPLYYESSGSFKYTGKPEWRTAETDFADTYCEVDLAAQHFWYYENGVLKYQCDIVSGMPTDAKNTPGGVYKLWYKERDKTLEGSTSEGEPWSTFVSYWNNISTFGVGLHDAWWHESFGGDRYTYAGSHGCINMPYNAAKFVYENIDYDTPVFMYW